MPFQGFALCLRVWWKISRERTLGYSPPPPSVPACRQAEKSQITKSPPLAVKKVRLRRYKKRLPYYLSVAPYNYTISCFFTANGGLFERPTAAFFTMAFCVYIISLLNPNQPNDRFVFIHPAFYPFKEKPFVQIITNGFYLHIGSSFQFPIKPSL